MSADLTICTVSYESGPYIGPNLALTERLNPDMNPHHWLICENSPASSPYRFSSSERENVILVEGLQAEDYGKATGSYHHAAGLARLLPLVKTRFLLVLDPDFFIIYPHWISAVLSYMEQNGLSFFGAPWHASYITKYRYFPCVHCVFIDLSKVDITTLDFRPAFDEAMPEPTEIPFLLKPFLTLLTKNQPERQRFLIDKRQTVGSSPDTGYRIYRQYAKDQKHRHACLTPAFNPAQDSKYLRNKTNRFLERLCPETLSYAPKRKDSYTPRHFRDVGGLDAGQWGWDEFFWQEHPFGFHIRNYLKTKHSVSTVGDQARGLEQALNSWPPFSGWFSTESQLLNAAYGK